MKTILIADDNEQNLYMLSALLRGHGYQVQTAEDGDEALRVARASPPDLVVSDILMPKKDGFALCREWRADEDLKGIPFVFYTATYTEHEDRELGLKLGADRFLLKPMEPDLLMTALEEVLAEAERHELSHEPPQTGLD
jgi:CheY-like chemotaxis protein